MGGEKLKGCPFCNGPAVNVAGEYVTCGSPTFLDCAGRSVKAEPAAWNTRAPAEMDEPTVERLIEVVLCEAREKGADSPVDYGDAEQIVRAVLAALPAPPGTTRAPADLRSALEAETETRFWSIVDGEGIAAVPSDMWGALEAIARKCRKYEPLIGALHDAINSPKGVVPDSADPFYRSSICVARALAPTKGEVS